MARTDRDQTQWFWKNHWANDCTRRNRWGTWGVITHCWCERVRNCWTQPYRYEKGIPSYYHKDQRRTERAGARHMMNQARTGHIDWDELVIQYRRPYYW
jgi:hypothetical protein